jgi:hypothetical protein
VDDAVTGQTTSVWAEINTSENGLVVQVPTEVPELTPRAARALFAILVGLAEVPVVDRLDEGIRDDR